MDFDQIRIFMVLAEERTFLGAANRLETSRSRVRRKLDQLERAAGTPLLSRETSGLVLTPAGEVLARRGRALLQDAERLISSVHEIGTQPTGRLRLALPLGPPAAAWIDALAELQSRHLQLEVEVSFDARPSRLLPTRAEVALTFEEQIAGGHEVVELAETPMRLLAGDGYLSAHGRPATSADLSLERVASWRPHDAWPDSLPLAGGAKGAAVAARREQRRVPADAPGARGRLSRLRAGPLAAARPEARATASGGGPRRRARATGRPRGPRGPAPCPRLRRGVPAREAAALALGGDGLKRQRASVPPEAIRRSRWASRWRSGPSMRSSQRRT